MGNTGCSHRPRWSTEGLEEVSRCSQCDQELDRVAWTLPLSPPWSGACMNCGGSYRGGRCTSCGLTEAEDRQVHEELRQQVSPELGRLEAAETAARTGRLVLALKLATAAVQLGPKPPSAWVLRNRLLRALDLNAAAVQDARELCRAQPHWGQAFSELAYALHGAKESGARAAADMALSIDPELESAQALRAELLYNNNRFGAARQDAMAVLRGPDSAYRRQALGLMVRYTRRLMELGEVSSARELLDALGKDVLVDAELLALLAWQRWKDGRLDEARAALAEAERLDPELPLAQDLRRGPLAPEGGFFRWLLR
ncbi:MAG: hypothetical protein VX899_23235 [Myxococcota bacterium]|nr:hypothetical protein [Myxococcota bacterium]